MGKEKHNFYKNLSRLVENSPLTLTTIAKKAGVNKSTLHNYTNGILPGSLKTIESLADFFNINPADLVYGDLTEEIQVFDKISGPEEYHIELVIKKMEKSGPKL